MERDPIENSPFPLELTVLATCRNQIKEVSSFTEAWLQTLRDSAIRSELLIINNGSNDGTGRILDNLRRENSELRVQHQLQGRSSRAIQKGYETARGNWILQVPFGCVLSKEALAEVWKAQALTRVTPVYCGEPLRPRSIRERLFLWFQRRVVHQHVVPRLFDLREIDLESPARLVPHAAAKMVMARLSKDYASLDSALAILMGTTSPCRLSTPPAGTRGHQREISELHYLADLFWLRLELARRGKSPGGEPEAGSEIPSPI